MQKLADLTHAAAEAPAVTEPPLGSVTWQGGEQASVACAVLGCAGWTPLQTAAAAAQQAPVEAPGEAAADATDEGAVAALPHCFALHAAFLPARPALLALPCPRSVRCQHHLGPAAVVVELSAQLCWLAQSHAQLEVMQVQQGAVRR